MGRIALLAGAALALLSSPAAAGILGGSQAKPSSGRNEQTRGQAEIPVCARPIGTISIVEPDTQWWRQLNLGSPEAIIKVFVQKSNCFTLVNRGRSLQSRAMEKALAEQGELQAGAAVAKKGQVKAAQYFLEPNIVTANQNSGGSGLGAAAGALGGLFGGAGSFVGGIAGGINVKKGEANVTLSVVNAATTEENVVEGYFRKRDLSFALGGGGGWWGGFAAAGGYGYENTEIGQIIVLAYLDAYKKLVVQLGGMPAVTGAPAQPPPGQ
jgi:curli biogenesis system outer membrane secretion channel CsgG